MRVSARTLGSVAILDLEGRLTVEEDGRSLNQQLNGLIHNRRRNFIINLYCVTDIDCSGIAQLLRCYARARYEGGDLKLLHLGHRMRDLFARRGLLTVFELYNDEGEAAESFLDGQVKKGELWVQQAPSSPMYRSKKKGDPSIEGSP